MTQAHFGQLVHAHPATVSRWENGVMEPDDWQLDIMLRLQQAVINRPGAADDAREKLIAGAVGLGLGILLAAALSK